MVNGDEIRQGHHKELGKPEKKGNSHRKTDRSLKGLQPDIIEETFVVRKMKMPTDVQLSKKSLVRWLALALGIANPNDKRDTAVKILDSVLFINFSKNMLARPRDISVKTGIDEKLVDYHLRKMLDKGILERKRGGYVFLSDQYGTPSLSVFKANIDESLRRASQAVLEIKRMYE